MKTLLLLRHAKSSWKDSSLPDHERPLNKRGKSAAPLIGKLIRKQKLVPEQILSSTAVRARTTADIVAKNCGYKGAIELTDALYMANAERLAGVVSKVGDDPARVMVVAHNPGLDELLDALTRSDEHLPTAALAEIALPIESWKELNTSTRGKLIQLLRPRELD